MNSQDSMIYEMRMTLNTIVQQADAIRPYLTMPVTPFPMNHPLKRDTSCLSFDEGHYLFAAMKDMKKALECFHEHYQIHVAAETGEHAVVAVDHRPKWNRWSQREDVQGVRQRAEGNKGRMKIFEEE